MDPLDQIIEYRNLGNEEYRKGIFLLDHTAGRDLMEKACYYYGLGLHHSEELLISTEKDNHSSTHYQEIIGLKKILLLNLAAGGLKLKTFDQVLSCCDEILANIDPHSVKAVFRRGMALAGLHRDAEAEMSLRRAHVQSPSDTKIKHALYRVQRSLQHKRTAEALHQETIKGKQQIEHQTNATLVESILTKNGGMHEKYFWSQDVREIHVVLRTCPSIENPKIDLSMQRCCIQFPHEGVFLEEMFHGHINVQESHWTIEEGQEIHLYLMKKIRPDDKPEACWWSKLFVSESQAVDVSALIVDDVQDLPQDTREKMKHRFIQLHDEDRLKEWQEPEGVEVADSFTDPQTNPRKQSFANALRKRFPTIPVTIR